MAVVLTQGKWNDGAGTLGESYREHDYGERYPPGLNLRPDSEEHGRLLSILRQMALEGWSGTAYSVEGRFCPRLRRGHSTVVSDVCY